MQPASPCCPQGITSLSSGSGKNVSSPTGGPQRNNRWGSVSLAGNSGPVKLDIMKGVREPDPRNPKNRRRIGTYQNVCPAFIRSKRCCPCEPFQYSFLHCTHQWKVNPSRSRGAYPADRISSSRASRSIVLQSEHRLMVRRRTINPRSTSCCTCARTSPSVTSTARSFPLRASSWSQHPVCDKSGIRMIGFRQHGARS